MVTTAAPAAMLRDPQYYFNRELSWIQFNSRVLEEAQDRNNPLLERLFFLSVFASNLDEFFMVRVAGIKEQINARVYDRTPDGLTPKEQIRKIAEALPPLIEEHSRVLTKNVLPGLARHGLTIKSYKTLTDAQHEHLHQHFRRRIFPLLTPLALDPAHPTPPLQGLNVNLMVELRTNGSSRTAESKMAFVPLPNIIPRFVRVPDDEDEYAFIPVERIIEEHLDELFPNTKVVGVSKFRLTRNSDLDISDEDADDLLELVERELQRRRLGAVVRLEVLKGADEAHLALLKEVFELHEDDIYVVNSYLGVDQFRQLLPQLELPEQRYDAYAPAQHPVFQRHEDMFGAMRERDVLLHHPYYDFSPVVKMLQTAARDPHVLVIKQTLYRITSASPIVRALKEAALAGKQVTVVIEIKARFDEANNITWARELEEAGANVIYGVMGLKTHCKCCLILRNEGGELRAYAHLGSGNYNENTARAYTDLGFFTSNSEITQDVIELFNYLTGVSCQRQWRKILVAPITMRQGVLHHLQEAAASHSADQPSRVRIVINSLVDPEMIRALYQAAMQGVRIDLMVRGVCALRPGLPGVSDNITVRSIVGRFLEHSRIYEFAYGGQVHLYSGSADLMTRNLNRRVEVAFPLENRDLKLQVSRILDILFSPRRKTRMLQPDGQYLPTVTAAADDDNQSAQDTFMDLSRKPYMY